MKAVIIDADLRFIEMIEKTFLSLEKEDENAGIDVEETFFVAGNALNGKDGYELIKKERPDLVVMDLKLPELGGISLLRKTQAGECRSPCSGHYGRYGLRTRQTGYRAGD